MGRVKIYILVHNCSINIINNITLTQLYKYTNNDCNIISEICTDQSKNPLYEIMDWYNDTIDYKFIETKTIHTLIENNQNDWNIIVKDLEDYIFKKTYKIEYFNSFERLYINKKMDFDSIFFYIKGKDIIINLKTNFGIIKSFDKKIYLIESLYQDLIPYNDTTTDKSDSAYIFNIIYIDVYR